MQSRRRGLFGFHESAEGVLVALAFQRMRLSGPALVHQDDVAALLNRAEDLTQLGGELGGTLPGPTGQEEEGIWITGPDGRQHDDLQGNLAAGTALAVLEYPQTAAERVFRPFIGRARGETVGGGGGSLPGPPRRYRGRQQRDPDDPQ